MGIPSFYRHLLRRYPHLVTKGVGAAPEWLCMDFNCAMYTVLRQMRSGNDAAWETEFANAIADYMTKMVIQVAPTSGVYVSCDGVVCAAKRRQQRLRRFKGPWMSAAEADIRAMAGEPPSAGEPKWDQNALTPGTAFMALLGDVLVSAGARLSAERGIPVTVSTTAEPGEGEHKLLRKMREVRPTSCTIYGLDADLILLAMLLDAETGADVRLLREAQEFEAREGGWRTVTIRGLREVMLPASSTEQVQDFVAGMSLLGNDFLPRSLTKTVRDDGIPVLIEGLKSVWAAGQHIVMDGGLNRDGLLTLLRPWATTEEKDLIAVAKAAKHIARRRAVGGTAVETAVQEWMSQPARWCSVAQIATVADWRSLYRRVWRSGTPGAYIRGLAWVWDYYSGRPVDQGWQFEPHLPPLWSDVVAVLEETCLVIRPPPVVWDKPLPGWLHLLSVLPAESVERLLPKERMRLMGRAPWYWPSEWSLFDVGRTQLWECEPVIPTIPETVLRSWVTE